MKIIFFGTNIDTIDEFKTKHSIEGALVAYDVQTLIQSIQEHTNSVVIADYDSVAPEINKMISSNTIVENLIVLENTPEIITGKMLVSHKVKAYGNIRMLNIHYKQMIETVNEEKVWTYPELTAALVRSRKKTSLSEESLKFVENRLTDKEKDVLLHVLDGLTNDAIANNFGITTRTIKAHMSSIFSKLHVNDRLGLVLLLK